MAKDYITIPSESPSPLVSVILPIYNAEPFLDQALDSAEGQTYRNIEILCVNDGSKDDSLRIMNEHAARDSRIRVIDKPNGGYGSAMNRGLSEAQGEWIAILEPDDWIEPDMFKDLVGHAATFDQPLDIVKSPYWRIVYPDTPEQRKLNCTYRNQVKVKKQPCTIKELVDLLPGNHPSIWSAIYRRRFLEENGIRFLEIPGAGWTDNPFFMETLCKAKRIGYVDKPFYCYREETRAKTIDFHKKNPMIPFERWHQMLDIMEECGIDDPELLLAHYSRGFTYMGGVLEQHAVEEPEIRQACTDMFARMKPELIKDYHNVSPVMLRLYYELSGNEPQKIHYMKYGGALVKKALGDVSNVGITATAGGVAGYLKRYKVRGGNR